MAHLETICNVSVFGEVISRQRLLEADGLVHILIPSEKSSVGEIISSTDNKTEGKDTSLVLLTICILSILRPLFNANLAKNSR